MLGARITTLAGSTGPCDDQECRLLRYVKLLIALRKSHPALRRRTFFRGSGFGGEMKPDVIWHGVEPLQPDFSATSRTLAFCPDAAPAASRTKTFKVLSTPAQATIDFSIPPSPSGRPWRRVIDTFLPSPRDIVEATRGASVLPVSRYTVSDRSMLVLVSEP